MSVPGRRPGWLVRLSHRVQTGAELLAWMARRRPWVFPMLAGLLALWVLVSLAQASQIAPLIYTLF